MSRTLRSAALLFGLMAAAAACRSDPEMLKQRAFVSAEAYFEARKFGEAIVEYRKALQFDPNFGRARFKLAEAYAANNELKNAYPEYVRAGDLLKDDLEVQIKAGNMFLLGRRFQEAKDRARTILQQDPSNLAGLLLLGNALAGLQDLDNAVAVTQRAIKLDPDRSGIYANLGTLQLARGNRDEAERAFAEAVKRNPTAAGAWLAQGNFYRAVGDLDRAERSFSRALEVAPDDPRANRVAASHFIETNRPERAEPYLRRVAEGQNDQASWLDLADFYLNTKRFDEARGVLTPMLSRNPHFEVHARLALVEHAAGRTKEAHDIVARVLGADPNNASALALQARLLLTENRPDDALVKARAALQADPQSAQGHFMLGRVHVARDALEEARKSFVQVLAINPTAADAKLELARLHMQRGELDTAIDYAERTISSQPENMAARLVLARSLMVRPDDRPRARLVMDGLLQKYPASAAVHSALGAFHLTTGARAAARKDFATALELDPSFLEALSSLVAMDLADRRAPEAWRRLEARLQQSPKDPDLLMIAAKFAFTVRDMHAAEELLRRLIVVAPASMEAYPLLGQLFIRQGRLKEATAEFEAMTRRDPRSVAAHTMMGLLLHAQKDVPGAVKYYEKAVELDPGAASAANNLAWLYAENDENLELALQLAQSAKARLPLSAEVNDTLGWIYYKKGLLAQAIQLLEQSVERDPSNAMYRYHLGMALAKNGDDAKARRALEQTLTLNPTFARADDVKRVMATLVY